MQITEIAQKFKKAGLEEIIERDISWLKGLGFAILALLMSLFVLTINLFNDLDQKINSLSTISQS